MEGKNDKEKGYLDMQFRVSGEMKNHLLKWERRSGQTRAAIGREALYYYLFEKIRLK